MRVIFKDQEKYVPYGSVSHDKASVIQCDRRAVGISSGTIVSLAVLTKGEIKTVKSAIGEVIEANKDTVKIQFNESFGYDNCLHALVHEYDFKTPAKLMLLYKEA